MFKLCFGIVIYTNVTDKCDKLTIPLHRNLRIWRNWPAQSCRAARQELSCPQYLLLRWCSRGHDTVCEHCTLLGTIICANFFVYVLSSWRWPIHAKMGAQSFSTRCRISNPVFLVFHDNCQDCLKYILLLLQFEIFSAFSLQGIASSKLLPCMYWFDEFFNQSAKSLDIQASPRASTFVKNIFTITYCMHATTFTPHKLNHLRAITMFAFTL